MPRSEEFNKIVIPFALDECEMVNRHFVLDE